MRLRLISVTLVVALLSAFIVAPLGAAAERKHFPRTDAPASSLLRGLPVTGTLEDGGTFTGTLDINSLDVDNGQLFADTTVTGVVKDATGEEIGTVSQDAVLPLQVTGTCQILTLVLGPLHLDLLGLVVDLNQVILNVTGQTGPGMLLGNLLCSLAGLFDNLSLLESTIDLINEIIA